eukprot:Awhi_evm1s14775
MHMKELGMFYLCTLALFSSCYVQANVLQRRGMCTNQPVNTLSCFKGTINYPQETCCNPDTQECSREDSNTGSYGGCVNKALSCTDSGQFCLSDSNCCSNNCDTTTTGTCVDPNTPPASACLPFKSLCTIGQDECCGSY